MSCDLIRRLSLVGAGMGMGGLRRWRGVWRSFLADRTRRKGALTMR